MNGPAHYVAAEQRLRASDWQRQEAADEGDLTTAMHEAACAQVHATLALAAATALHPDCPICEHPEHPGRTCTVVTSGVLSCGCTP